MRTLVIKTIVKQYFNGLRDSGLAHVLFTRTKNFTQDVENLSLGELEGILAESSNEELLYILDQQACDRYR